MVVEYFDKKMLAGLGYSFNFKDLTTFELDCYRVISSEINKLQKKDLKKKKK